MKMIVIEDVTIKTDTGIVTKQKGETFDVHKLSTVLKLIKTGKVQAEMNDLMRAFLRLDHNTNSPLYIDERIHLSQKVLKAYEDKDTAQFCMLAAELIILYQNCHMDRTDK